MDPLDPALLDRDEVRAALAVRDVGALYRLLKQFGVTQREIAQLTSQSPSEVCEILKGRRVRDVWVLERIADGLGVPRAWIGLSYGEEGSSVGEGLDEEMKRRALITATTVAALGEVVQGLGEFTEVALPAGQALPSRLGMAHVHVVQAVTNQLRGTTAGRRTCSAPRRRSTRRGCRCPRPRRQAQLAAALAELDTEAGWCCHDSGLDGTGHFIRALQMAGKAGDTYGIANAAWHAGATLVRSGHPDDALKLFQLGQFRLGGVAPGTSTSATRRVDDPRVATLTARLTLNSATAYVLLDAPDQARRCVAEVHDGWAPRDAFERAHGDLMIAGIQLDLGQLDSAEQFAASAMRIFSEGHRQGRTLAELLRAEVHVRAGEPRGLTLARQAIEGASALQSVATRQKRLVPLAAALEARPGSDTQELARMARQIAATRI